MEAAQHASRERALAPSTAPVRRARWRILVVTEHYWPEAFRITDLALGLQSRGHEVEVLTGMPSYPVGRYFDGYRPWGPFAELHEGIRIHRVPIVPRGDGSAWRLVANYGSFVAAASARIPFLGRWDAVLVFQPSPVTTCIPALLLRRLTRTPVAMWVQDLWPDVLSATSLVRRPWLVAAAGRLSRRLYARCDLLLAQSRSMMDRLRDAGVSPERLEYLPNWAEELYAAPPLPPAGGAAEAWERGFPVVFAGNLGRVQALETVLEAARLMRDDPDVRWVFAGDGALREWLERAAAEAGLRGRVHLLGRLPVADMPGLYARAGAMLVSLKSDPVADVTIPSKLQSYLAAGRPILASIGGEAARVVEESGAGIVAAPGDPAALASAVRRMKALPPSLRAEMGRRGRACYEREFDRSACLDRLEGSVAEMIERAWS